MIPVPARDSQSVASRATLALSAASLFFLSFLMSGSANVLPQLFYQSFYPQHKALLVALTLFLSTVSALIGVAASKGRSKGLAGVLLGLAIATGAALTLLSTQQAVLYILLISVIQFSDNYLLNQVDHAAVARTTVQTRGFNDVMGNIFRLLGMLAAPAFFTSFIGNRTILLGVVAALGLIAGIGAIALFRTDSAEAAATFHDTSRPLDRADRLLFGYAVSVYVALYLFAANMIYLLRDLLQMADAELRGGRAIVVVFIAAAVVNGAAGGLRRPRRQKSLPAAALGAPALAPIFALPSLQRSGGGTYGLFLLELRGYVSWGAREEGKTLLLTRFNNMANVSAALAFGLMIALAIAKSQATGSLYIWTLGLIGGIPATGLFLFWSARRALAHNSEPDALPR
jgi:hypothetical protein